MWTLVHSRAERAHGLSAGTPSRQHQSSTLSHQSSTFAAVNKGRVGRHGAGTFIGARPAATEQPPSCLARVERAPKVFTKRVSAPNCMHLSVCVGCAGLARRHIFRGLHDKTLRRWPRPRPRPRPRARAEQHALCAAGSSSTVCSCCFSRMRSQCPRCAHCRVTLSSHTLRLARVNTATIMAALSLSGCCYHWAEITFRGALLSALSAPTG